jgi:hypothetical protein
MTIYHETTDAVPTYHLNPRMSRAFEPIYQTLFANYEQVRLINPVYQEPSLLIIYGGNPPMSQINRLVNWKKQRGFVVEAVAASEITGNAPVDYRNFIRNAYNTWDNPPEFVMLIGSAARGVYRIPSFSADGTDYPFTFMTDNNPPGDIFIGRLPAEDENQLGILISKIIEYEQTPFMSGDDTWFQNTVLVGDSNASGVSAYIMNRYVKSLIERYDPEHGFRLLFERQVLPEQMIEAINEGALNFSFRGYIGMSGFSLDRVRELVNEDRLINLIALTCDTGSFGHGRPHPSITELFARHATDSGISAGAITAVGTASSETSTAHNNVMGATIFSGLYSSNMATVGQALLLGRIYIMQVYASYPSRAGETAEWTNLMGDPSNYS